jgi:glycerate-2-kinase
MLIKNKSQLIKNAKTKEIKKLRRDILDSLEAAVLAVDPYFLIKNNLKRGRKKLTISGKLNLNLANYKNIYAVGAGKAAFAMARGLEAILGKKIKKGFINVQEVPKNQKLKRVKVTRASHPYPNQAGVLGAKKILNLAKKAKAEDLVFVLISGGGSALLPLPAPGITLKDKAKINQLLVRSKTKIQEINTVRKHISAIKGGQLAKAIYPATTICFYLSDVVGDDLFSIASGPCMPDKTTFSQAIKILKRHRLWTKTPKNIKKYLLRGAKNKKLETPKPDDPVFRKGKFYLHTKQSSDVRMYHFILGSNKAALLAGQRALKRKKYHCQILTDKLQGEIHQLAKKFASLIKKIQEKKSLHKFCLPGSSPGFAGSLSGLRRNCVIKTKSSKKPCIILAGGETTLDLRGKGMGGRNQELVMVMTRHILPGTVFASFNTDGVDGRSTVPVAGGICDEWTFLRGKKTGLKIEKYIKENNSYHYLDKLGETLLTGKTGTNVGDIVMIGIV